MKVPIERTRAKGLSPSKIKINKDHTSHDITGTINYRGQKQICLIIVKAK